MTCSYFSYLYEENANYYMSCKLIYYLFFGQSRLLFPLSKQRSSRCCKNIRLAQFDGIYRVPVDEFK